MRSKLISQNLIMQRREEGRSQNDTGVFEINLVEWKMVWANDYVLDRSGFTLDQIQHMTLLDLIPEVFHGAVQNAMVEADSNGSTFNHDVTSVWPMKTSEGKVTWWAVTKKHIDFPMVWIHGDHIQTTNTSGMPFVFMRAFMRAANGQTGLYKEVSDLKNWTASQISRLDEEDKQLKSSIAAMEEKMNDVLETSKETATAVKTMHETMGQLKESFSDFEAKYGVEILKLIGTDTVHDKRIDAFERHVKMVTDLAVRSIEVQAKASTEGLAEQAKESSRGLSKKVVIPVSVVALLATILQFLFEHFMSK